MLDNDIYYSEHASIYPGKYEPMPWKEKELLEEFKKGGIRRDKPPVNICEQTDQYRIEIAAPGFSREDFVIYTYNHLLSIFAMNKKIVMPEDSHYRVRSFICNYIKRDVDLPVDVDTDFGTAEYRNGILFIYLYKSSYQTKNRHVQIIVY